jgi:hypothetical protein
MKRKALTLMLTLMVTGCAAGSTGTNGQSTTEGVAHPVCQEDEACWDCTTMGNKRCGPMINGVAAEQAAHEAVEKAGPGWQCWPEINLEQPDGYEVICNQY